MCRPTPPTTLPTVTLVCACAALKPAIAMILAAATAAPKDRTMFTGFLPEARLCWRCFRERLLSAAWRVELGRHVVHFLERRVQQRTRQELLRVWQWLVGRPLL